MLYAPNSPVLLVVHDFSIGNAKLMMRSIVKGRGVIRGYGSDKITTYAFFLHLVGLSGSIPVV